jgi:hypothetical protein
MARRTQQRGPIFASATIVAALGVLAFQPSIGRATTITTYQFELNPANTTLSPSGGGMAAPGDLIVVSGSGTFTPATGAVKAFGRFTHYNADGRVHCQGTWKATSLGGFTSFGQDASGDVGGVISMTTSHYCKTMGMTMTGVPMTVTSAINAPAGTTEGTVLGPFTQPTGGSVWIQEQ